MYDRGYFECNSLITNFMEIDLPKLSSKMIHSSEATTRPKDTNRNRLWDSERKFSR